MPTELTNRSDQTALTGCGTRNGVPGRAAIAMAAPAAMATMIEARVDVRMAIPCYQSRDACATHRGPAFSCSVPAAIPISVTLEVVLTDHPVELRLTTEMKQKAHFQLRCAQVGE